MTWLCCAAWKRETIYIFHIQRCARIQKHIFTDIQINRHYMELERAFRYFAANHITQVIIVILKRSCGRLFRSQYTYVYTQLKGSKRTIVQLPLCHLTTEQKHNKLRIHKQRKRIINKNKYFNGALGIEEDSHPLSIERKNDDTNTPMSKTDEH